MTDFVVKNRTSKLVIQLKRRDGSAYDLSGKGAFVIYRISDGIKKVKTATILSPPTEGKIEYIFDLIGGLDDLYASGPMYVGTHAFDSPSGLNAISSAEILQLVVRDVIKQP